MCLITSIITDGIGRHEFLLLPIYRRKVEKNSEKFNFLLKKEESKWVCFWNAREKRTHSSAHGVLK